MKKTGLVAVALAAAALAACAPRYGYHGNYAGHYQGGPRGDIYYTDRERYNDSYYENGPSREYRDYNGGSRDWRR